MRAPDRTLDTDAEHPVEYLVSDFLDRFVAQQHCVVDHGIDSTPLPRELARCIRKRGAIRDVRDIGEGVAACRTDTGGSGAAIVTVDVDQSQRRATAGKFLGDLAAETAARARHENCQFTEIVLNGHRVYFNASFHAAPSRTIQPEVGSQKWVPMIITFLSA